MSPLASPPVPARPRAPHALLFDLDGTLVDSRRDIAASLNAALEQAGRPPLPLADVLPMVGDGARKLVERALAAEGTTPDDGLVARVTALYLAAYLAAPCVHTELLAGARESLAIGLPRALVTNKPRAIALGLLDGLGLHGAFDAIYAAGDGPLKPAPDGVHAACAALGVAPETAWLVGDGPQDVQAGRAAGAVTIAVPGIADRAVVLAAGPDVVLGSLAELPELVRAARAPLSA